MSLLIDYPAHIPYPTVLAIESIRRRDAIPDDQLALIVKDPAVAEQLVAADNAGQLELFLMSVDWNGLAGVPQRRLPAHAIAISVF